MPAEDLSTIPIGELFARRARSHHDKTFVRFRDRELTYSQVDRASNDVAHGLVRAGVRSGDHVAMMLPNSPDFVVVLFALVRLGAVVVPVNTAHRGELLRHVLENSDSTTLIIDSAYVDRLAPLLPRLTGLDRVVVNGTEGDVAGSTALAGVSAVSLSSLRTPNAEPVHVEARPWDLHAIMYTSGTTGPSKGVLVPHLLALANASDVRRFASCAGKTIYCPLPLFHAAALWDGLYSTLLVGAQIAVVERFSASRFWDDVRRFDAQVVLGVPSMIPILLKQEPDDRDREHPLETFYTGKSALDAALFARFGVRSVETYTSTEVGVATGSFGDTCRPGSCGRANDSRFEVAVVDEHDEFVEPGGCGELVVRPRHPNTMAAGYYRAPDATADAFRNLWFHTGDRVRQDADGYFYFVDRIKDSIRRRGENISAFDLECAVNLHPAVVESAAIAVPSQLEEDDVKVVAVTRPGTSLTPAQLVEFCEDNVPTFMVPRYVELVDALPKTANGKVAKFELRAAGTRGITPETWDREAAQQE
jgi:crotonobetaine/carnitine-CoA ligase